jgi:hypothetical protein
MIKLQWQKICLKIAFWLCVEIILTLIGMDNIADYSEFILHSKSAHQYNSLLNN